MQIASLFHIYYINFDSSFNLKTRRFKKRQEGLKILHTSNNVLY